MQRTIEIAAYPGKKLQFVIETFKNAKGKFSIGSLRNVLYSVHIMEDTISLIDIFSILLSYKYVNEKKLSLPP